MPEKVEEIVLELQKTVVKRRKFDLEVKSMEAIHGISQSMLEGAPTLDQVKTHILSLLSNFEKQTKEKVVFVGHGLINDIEALHLEHARFIDTTNFKFKSDQQGKIRKLKDLAQEHLGINCQAGHHSSIEDAEVAMQLFLKFQNHPEGFYADKTIQTYVKSKKLKELEEKLQMLRKKRAKKVHRKELLLRG